MKQSINFGMNLPDGNNVVDIDVLNANIINTIDKGLTLDVGTSTGIGNNYVLNLGSITLSSANKGITFKFWADKNSTGAVTINGTYNLIKDNGNPIKNIKINAPYTITYDGGTNFFLSSGGDESDTTTVGTDGSNVLTGITFVGSDGEVHNGTMPNRGNYSNNIGVNGSVDLPPGYYTGIHVGQNITTRGSYTDSVSNAVSGDILYTRIPQGAYFTNTSTGYPEIRTAVASMSAVLGFNANNVHGNVGGINGTVKEHVFREIRTVRGYKFDVDFTPMMAIRCNTGDIRPKYTGYCIMNPDNSVRMVQYEWNNGAINPIYLKGNRVYLDTYANENLSMDTGSDLNEMIFLVGYK